MPTAQSATIADLVKDLTPLRITALSADDPAVQQVAIDAGEVEVMGRLSCSAFPAYAALSATGQAQIQRFTLRYARFHLIERVGKMGDAERDDRTRLDKDLEDYRSRAMGLAAIGEPLPSPMIYAPGPALVFRPGSSAEGGTMWGR